MNARAKLLSCLLAIGTLASMADAVAAHAQAKPETSPNPQLTRSQFIADMGAEFRKMDSDRNGQLTRSEIEQYQKLQAIAQAEARNRQLFTELDTDNNGRLSPAEFAKLVRLPLAHSAQPMLSRMDGNRDQQISLVEHRTATLANFDRLDVDRDGKVSAAEMKAGGITPH